MDKGRGWHGERRRHREAAVLGHSIRGNVKPQKVNPEKWYKAEGSLYGWSKDMRPEERQKCIRKSIKKDGLVRTYHKLMGLANVTADKETEKADREDYNWMLETFSDLKKKLTPKKAIQTWESMSPKERADAMPERS